MSDDFGYSAHLKLITDLIDSLGGDGPEYLGAGAKKSRGRPKGSLGAKAQAIREAVGRGATTTWGWGERFRTESCWCDSCGRAFAASRFDARYCSSACRQKAYRERKAAT